MTSKFQLLELTVKTMVSHVLGDLPAPFWVTRFHTRERLVKPLVFGSQSLSPLALTMLILTTNFLKSSRSGLELLFIKSSV